MREASYLPPGRADAWYDTQIIWSVDMLTMPHLHGSPKDVPVPCISTMPMPAGVVPSTASAVHITACCDGPLGACSHYKHLDACRAASTIWLPSMFYMHVYY